MPGKRTKTTKSSGKTANDTVGKSSAVPTQRDRKNDVVLETVDAVYGVYHGMQEAERAVKALKRAGFRDGDISVSPIVSGTVMHSVAVNAIGRDTYDRRDAPGGIIARIAGVALGVCSVAFATPILVALGIATQFHALENPVVVQVNTHDPAQANKAVTELLRSGGQQVGLAGQCGPADNDLKRREYQDELGRIHHHTHTYLRDHADEQQRGVAA